MSLVSQQNKTIQQQSEQTQPSKQKQEKPLQFIKEVELLRLTEDRKDLSTSTSTIEDPQDKMMRQAQGKNPTTGQSTKSVSTRSMSLEI